VQLRQLRQKDVSVAAASGSIDITPPNSAGNLERGEEGEAERRTLALSFPSGFRRGEREGLPIDDDDALVVALLLRPPEALTGFGPGLE